ncbi:hypothetical protein [Chromobacterium violaceum]|uniref:Uncharacterized protein n=1 Tax=Chromobacterium violaceum TaxID=536 RepID=A0A202BDR1_CHRVL|nr:hypothetical protein [Chromobacterium violaceum]OVE49471.1 hypothetical protein CBW21_06200 [Chromobacterium violaceum]
MNELILADEVVPTPAELNNLSTQTLREELARSVELTARHLMRLATIWSELERRGEDLSDLRVGLAAFLPQIAARQLSADAVIRFAGQKLLLNAVATLPLAEQERLARGGSVQLLSYDGHGDAVVVDVAAHALSAQQIRQVFDFGKIRSIDEQRPRLMRPAPPKKKAISTDVRYDRQTGLVQIGRRRVPIAEILAAVSREHNEIQESSGEDKISKVLIELTEEQHRNFRINGAKSGAPLKDLAFIAVLQAGLLDASA